MKKLFLAIASILALFLLFVLASNTESKEKPTESTATASWWAKRDCFGATTKDNYDLLLSISRDHDEDGLKNMIKNGRVYFIPSGTSVTMRKAGFALCQVYVSKYDVTLFVASEDLSHN